MRQRKRRKISDAIYDVGANAVKDGWKDAVADQLATVLNEQLWAEIQKRRGDRKFCENLAFVAKQLDLVADAPKTVAGWLAEHLLRVFKRPPLEQRLAKKIAEQVAEKVIGATAWPSYKFKIIARLLRICGVWTCIEADLTLRGCECFKDLAEDVTKDYIKGILEAKLDQIV